MESRKRSRFGDSPSEPPAKKPSEAPMSPRSRARQIAARLSMVAAPPAPSFDGGGLNQMRKKVYIPVNEYPDINFIGLLIGPKGQTNRQMCEESGAKITIRGRGSKKDPSQEENDDLHVLICADKESQLEKAERMVRDILFDPSRAMQLKRNQLNTMGGGGDRPQPYMDPNSVARAVEVPSNLCGAIIGRQGGTIRDIIEKSGAHVQVEQPPADNPNAVMRTVTVTGKKDNVDKAEKLILQVVADHQTNRDQQNDAPGSNGAFSTHFRLPNNKIGLVIGRQGATVKMLQDKHRCSLQIPDGPDADNPLYRSVHITAHSQQDIENVKQEILNTIAPPGVRVGSVQDLVEDLIEASHTIPNDKVGLVIGKQGSTIKLIQSNTGCRIQIPSDPDPNSNPPTRTLSISGNRKHVDKAIEEINKYVHGRGPMESPYGNQGTWDYSQADWSTQWQQYYAQQHNQQQYNQHQAYNPQQQQYYGQQQQQQYSQAQQQRGAPPPPAPAPAQGNQAQPGTPQQQPGAQAAGGEAKEGEQKYTKAQWEQWKAYYKQYGYQMAEECPENMRADPFE